MRRLLAAAAVAAMTAVPVAPALAYSRSCGGVVDTECSGWVCPSDCWQRDCYLWIDVRHNSQTAQCVQPILPSS